MSISFLVDMNLTPEWVPALSAQGWTSVHWSSIGNPKARDPEIMAWALQNKHVIFTHDLDFGALLAMSHANGPSVLLLRGQNVLPEKALPMVLATLKTYEQELVEGALVVMDQLRSRVRILPI